MLPQEPSLHVQQRVLAMLLQDCLLAIRAIVQEHGSGRQRVQAMNRMQAKCCSTTAGAWCAVHMQHC